MELIRDTANRIPWKRTAVVAVCCVLVRRHWRNSKTYYVSLATSALTSYQRDDLRENMRRVLIDASKFHSHTHPEAASGRTTANNVIRSVLTLSGYSPYSISMSAKDMRDGIRGTRHYHTAKDLTMQPRDDKVRAEDAYMLIDVDYYVDMPNLLGEARPTALYTFCPTVPGGTSENSSFSIQDDVVTEKINGGATYSHRLWNYDTDCLVVDNYFSSVIYLVEQRKCDNPNRRMVLLVPIARVWLVGRFLDGHRLFRKRISYGDANYMRTQRVVDGQTKVIHSMSLQASYTSAEVDDRTFNLILTRCSLSKQPQISDAERILRELGNKEEAPVAAGILIYLWRTQPDLFKIRPILSTDGYVSEDYAYQTLGPLITEDGKPSMRAILPPIVDDSYAPVRSLNNDNACVDGRIKAIRNTTTSYPPFMRACLQEFVRYIVPDDLAHTGVPYSQEEVEEQQTRPAQRAKADQARSWMNVGKAFAVSAFQKSEAYNKITDPRNISTVPTDHKIRLSKYFYPLAHVIKKQHWYAFGLTPSEVSARLHDKAKKSIFCIPSDLSRLDGSTGVIHSHLLESVVTRYFARLHHKEVRDLLEREHDAKGVTAFGVKYDTGNTTLSGSPVTSIRNSLINAFHCYVALRMDTDSSDLAYYNLGLYGGDDGLTFDISPKKLEWSFTKAGLTIKTEVVQKNKVVPFLGRWYIDPWTTVASTIDIPRALRKLHLTSTPIEVPDYVCVYRKAQSLLVTDSTTPLLAEWAKHVIKLIKGENDTGTQEWDTLLAKANKDESWWSTFEDNFPPISTDERDTALTRACETLDVPVGEVEAWLDDILKCTNWAQLLLVKGLNVKKTPPTIPAVHRGVIVEPPPRDAPRQRAPARVTPDRRTDRRQTKTRTRPAPR